jgi:hypothetical protein
VLDGCGTRRVGILGVAVDPWHTNVDDNNKR